MKTKHLLTLLFLTACQLGFSTTWTITNAGFTFSPTSITISEGDSVLFSIASIHNSREVSQATWNANGNTQLPGGWQTANGGGLLLPTQLTVGTHYFVCAPHASMGMKGMIVVNPATGIVETTSLKGITVYPNPAKNDIHLLADKSMTGSRFQITDQTGHVVMEGQLESEKTPLDISRLSSGIYFITVGDDRQPAGKFIK